MHKGSKLYVEGRLTTRSWDDKESGKKIYRTEIVIGDISLLSDNGRTGKTGPDNRNSNNKQGEEATDDFAGLGISDSEIPF